MKSGEEILEFLEQLYEEPLNMAMARARSVAVKDGNGDRMMSEYTEALRVFADILDIQARKQ